MKLERPLQETERILREAAAEHEAVLVAFSGGKDALTTLDLCSRAFKRVEIFFMYLVPGLRAVQPMLDYAVERWGVKLHQYPHWILGQALANGQYCEPGDVGRFRAAAFAWKVQDVYELAAFETGIPLIATGQRKSDYLFRASNAKKAQRTQTICPIVGFNKFDVMSYLRARDIPVPDSQSGKQTTGVDLSTPSLLWLYDTYPDDFARVQAVFPDIDVVPARRKFYGIQ